MQIFEKYHGHSFFSAKINQVNKIEALFIPFWAASGSVRSKIINAQGNYFTRLTYWLTKHLTRVNSPLQFISTSSGMGSPRNKIQ
jgi:hypothetical protein